MVMTKINDQNMVIFTNKWHFLNYENKDSFKNRDNKFKENKKKTFSLQIIYTDGYIEQ